MARNTHNTLGYILLYLWYVFRVVINPDAKEWLWCNIYDVRHVHTHTVGSGHISPLTLVLFAFIDLVIMLLFKYLGASLLGTAAVALMFTAQIRATEDANKECELRIYGCLKDFQYVRLDADKDSCTRFIEKVVLCAEVACTTKEQKKSVAMDIQKRICSRCQTMGICTYNEILAEKEAESAELDEVGKHAAKTKSSIGKSSSSGATLSSSAVVVLLSALKMAWSVCM